ncbi:MAG: FAD-dependent oxidoreductase, partial [Chthoniobacterales bacterium]
MKPRYDVVILGAGHNGLVAASYLGRAGLSVLLLEKNDYIGGATISQKVFPDYDAHLSRYSYLVSLFPEKIIRDLGLKLELRRRATASFTPYVRNNRHHGLLLSNSDEAKSRESMFELTRSGTEFEQMKRFYNLARVFAEHSWDSMLVPLVTKEDFRRRFDIDETLREAWRSFVEEPLGRAIERYLRDDLVRGVVMTDGKIGVLTHPHDHSLVQNRCFLYHLIGNKTGEWKVPVGGMGAVARELEEMARKHGAEMLTNISLRKIETNGPKQIVEFENDGKPDTVEAKFLLVNFGRNVLSRFIGALYQPKATDEGSVFKINMLLRRLPKLRANNCTASEAFCGTFHTDEGYKEMQLSYEQAAQGRLADKPPSEVYCHTLTDDSILSPELRAQGFHTMTLFGLDTPWNLFSRDNETMRREAEKRFLASMNQWLEEPLENCLAAARDGSLCIESKSPVDIEDSLGMYHGNIFQNAPTFPFAQTNEQAGTWGVETEWENVFLCGSSAQRGGAVSGIPGHNAAAKVLSLLLLFVLALLPAAFPQEAVSKTNRSLLQPQMEVQLQPGDLNPADYLAGDWGGYRQKLHRAGLDVFAFYNAIFNGNITGGIHSGHASYVDDAWLGFKFDLEKLIRWKGGLFVVSGINRQ